MTADRIDERAAALAEGLAAHVARWARSAGAGPDAELAAAAAAAQVVRASGEGHVCSSLDDLAVALDLPAAAVRARLLGSGVVGTADAPRAHPLVIDAEGRLYLQRHFDQERRLAQRLLQAAQQPARPLRAAARARLDALFAGNAAVLDGAVDRQKAAAALALQRQLAVISGGPGTGKTTTVVNLLACLLAEEPGCRIALAAPTGKAAARLTESIRARAATLPAATRERLPSEAFTIHRLLGATPRGFAHHAGRPLAIDALVVDEASMLDLALAARLLDAVPAGARIVLLGDKDQLSAVEAGAVFAELAAGPAPLADSVVCLTHNFRFGEGSAIGRVAA
ncbi:MAG TPA: AAA family ATPase, partial [Burkholderiaceae bacterium]